MKPVFRLYFPGCKSRRIASSVGFTLPELLIAGIIFALLAGVTAQVMIGSSLQGRRLETAQRHREDFSRLNYIIQIEASEADQIIPRLSGNYQYDGRNYQAGVSGCTPGNTTGFTLYVPKDEGSYGILATNQGQRSGVQYYNADFNGDSVIDIVRCGPPVTRNGQLDHDATNPSVVTGLVLPNAQLANVATTAGLRSISYTVNFAGGNFGTAGATRTVTSHRKSVFVCNPRPGNPNEVEVGDCP